MLYVVNTLGGAVGVGLAGFLGMEWLGLRRTLWCAAGFDAAAIAALSPAIAMRERGGARRDPNEAGSAPRGHIVGLGPFVGIPDRRRGDHR